MLSFSTITEIPAVIGSRRFGEYVFYLLVLFLFLIYNIVCSGYMDGAIAVEKTSRNNNYSTQQQIEIEKRTTEKKNN